MTPICRKCLHVVVVGNTSVIMIRDYQSNVSEQLEVVLGVLLCGARSRK